MITLVKFFGFPCHSSTLFLSSFPRPLGTWLAVVLVQIKESPRE